MTQSITLRGVVVRGFGRGKDLGFPTANVGLPEGAAVPGNGIYAAWASVGEGGAPRMAAVSVGVNPTFDDVKHAVEAHLLDFDSDIYGERITLEFVDKLRDEAQFDSLDALTAQIRQDVDRARAVLETSSAVVKT